MKDKVPCGTACFDDHPPSDWNDAYAYEDDHGIVIELNPDVWIRVDPQDFPKLIALMATTMDGMVYY